jgi:D-alanine-D-alanine ligase
MSNKNLKVALLLGGTSPEREVSKSSCYSINKAIKNLGYEVKLIDPAYGTNQPEDENAFFTEEDYTEISNKNYVDAIQSSLLDDVDVVFIGLHGKWGEDGTIQSLLELRGIKYTGSNVLSSAMSMDKLMSKIMFKHYDIITPHWLHVEKDTAGQDTIIDSIEEKLKYPCVVKPNDQGSTVGLTICNSKEEVPDAVKLALKYSDKALIEEYISGHEVTVGILDDKALPVLEIKPKHGLYDYECKYTSGMSEYEVPANFPDNVKNELQEQAVKAFNVLGCRGYGRADFRLSEDIRPYCLEINTLPGMTSTSLVPKMAKAVGISFEELIDTIIKLSL